MSKLFIGILVVCVITLSIFLFRHTTTIIKTEVKVDTMWVIKDSFIYSKPKVVTEYVMVPDSAQPSEDCDRLKLQYKNLSESYYTLKMYEDTLQLDSIQLYIKDSVYKNRLLGRKVDYRLKYPYVKETITNTVKVEKNQLYVGAEGLGNSLVSPVSIVGAGLILKTKKDLLLGVKYNYDLVNKQGFYGAQVYWKINLKK